MHDAGVGFGGERSRTAVDGQSLVRYAGVLRERLWLILLCTVLGVGGAAAYVMLAHRTYQAQAEMLVQAANPSDPVLSSLPVLHQTGNSTEDVLTAASLVTTPRVANAVSAALASRGIRISPGAALGDVSATPIGQAGLVAVQATGSSPALAQSLANEFVAHTIGQTTALMHAAINNELPTLRGQLAAIPAPQRFGPGSLGAQLDELEQLLRQNNPTLVEAASAARPTSPSSPKPKLTLVAGLLGGILLGIAAAFASHALDTRIRREEQVRDVLGGLPVLARIPRERYPRRTLPLMPSDMSVVAHEGFRALRMLLTAAGTSGGACLVTGSAPAEGKSTTAINLALALAQGERRAILIEADLRKPSFAKAFGLEEFYGTEQVLIGEVELSEALQPVWVEGASIRVLAAHPSGGKLADRLSFAAARKLVEDARAEADYVVIDSPPLTEVIDALPFAKLVDEVLIVARLDHSRINRLQELDELLNRHGAAAAGLVLVGAGHRHRYYYGEEPNGATPERQRSSVGRDGERVASRAEPRA